MQIHDCFQEVLRGEFAALVLHPLPQEQGCFGALVLHAEGRRGGGRGPRQWHGRPVGGPHPQAVLARGRRRLALQAPECGRAMDGPTVFDPRQRHEQLGRPGHRVEIDSAPRVDALGAQRYDEATSPAPLARALVDRLHARVHSASLPHLVPGVVEAQLQRDLQLVATDHCEHAESSGLCQRCGRRCRGARPVRHAVRRQGEAHRGPYRKVGDPLGAGREHHRRQSCRHHHRHSDGGRGRR
mmetsp:Transcript_155090/g.497262  ORF Transcript_155090/g.497262 Transcript_155090/m.497262 type:complete len:241 (+) Transcript_155090:3330-4052(+)